MRIELPCPYTCQYDNTLHPGGSCNMTSLGMVLSQYGLADKVPGSQTKVSDRLLAYCDAHGLDRHDLQVIKNLAVKFGLQDDASYSHTFADIKAHLQGKNLVIVQGMFTASGHVIVFCGFDDKGLWCCNDPAGDTHEHTGRSGDHIWYPSDWVRSCAAPDGDGKVWSHLLRKR